MKQAFRATRNRGFTLIEVIIVVVVIGILVAIAFPSFESFIVKSNRADAHSALQNIQLLQERFRKDNGRYGDLAEIGAPEFSAEGCYRLNITAGRADYAATASARDGDNCRQLSRETRRFGTQCTQITLASTFAGLSRTPPECWPN